MRRTFPFLISFLLIPVFAPSLRAQELGGVVVQAQNDVFQREVDRARMSVQVDVSVPLLDCTIEYIRRQDGRDVVYRRGPIDMQQEGRTSGRIVYPPPATQPAPEGVESAPSFTGGMLLALPRPGEAAGEAGEVRPSSDGYEYLVRAALVPISYVNRELNARLILERALAQPDGDTLRIAQSEVYSKVVRLDGNLPLKFDLPRWEPSGAAAELMSPSLFESVLITLETPRSYAVSRNSPDPFSGSTHFGYAVPSTSTVQLAISIHGLEVVLDSGMRDAGRYEVLWNASSTPDGRYTADFSAEALGGSERYASQLHVRKDSAAPSYVPPARTAAASHLAVEPADRSAAHTEARSAEENTREELGLTAGLESGIAYQLPQDKAEPLRNMFTHIAARVGWRFGGMFEAGVLVGQDAFNEEPGPEVATEQIDNYGGVVARTYGYVGPYFRTIFGRGRIAGLTQASLAFSDAGEVLEISAGVRGQIIPRVEAYLAPSFMAHFASAGSYKLGIVYGLTVRF